MLVFLYTIQETKQNPTTIHPTGPDPIPFHSTLQEPQTSNINNVCAQY